jgi:2'-5' RNA ligase
VRVVPRGNLHVTVAFLGGRPPAEAAAIGAELRAAAGTAGAIRFRVQRYRETRSVGMVVLDDVGGHAAPFALDVFERLERLGVYERERRPWLPHVTVLRFRRPPGLRPTLPDLGELSPSGAAVYHSLLRPGGAQYVVLESKALGG